MAKNKHSAWITITPFSKALAMILFILLPFVGFYLGMRYEQALNPTSGTPSENSTANWQSFVTNPYYPRFTNSQKEEKIQRGTNPNDSAFQKIRFSISFPPDWAQGYINEKSLYDGDGGLFTFSKGEYKIQISTGDAGANTCQFPDENVPEQYKVPGGYYTNYSQINSFTSLRRVKVEDVSGVPSNPTTQTYVFCSKWSPQSGWQLPESNVGRIEYIVPKNPSSEELKTMDSILSTIRILK